MTARILLLMCLALFTVSCRPSAPPTPTETPSDRGLPDAKMGITVEAEGLPPEAKGVIADAIKNILSDAIHLGIQENVAKLYEQLKISDDVERRLLGGRYEWGSPDEANDTWGIFLIRPGDAPRVLETIELLEDGRPVLRFTRTFARVEKPIAIMTRSRVAKGRVSQVELLLTYGTDGKWEVARPTVKQDRLPSSNR